MKKLKNIISKLSCSEKEKINTYRELCVLFGVSEWQDLSNIPNENEKIEVMYEDYTTNDGNYVKNSFDRMLQDYKTGNLPKPVKWRYAIS